MIIGIPRERKKHEYRVGLTPAAVRQLVRAGHTVLVEAGAGEGAGFGDTCYREAGATLVTGAEDVFGESELVVKVKEPEPQEYRLLRQGQVLFTFLHLAANPGLTRILLEREVVAIAYETVQLDDGSLPLLAPMSEVAGKLSVQVGAHWLQKENGGSGVLLGAVPGVPPGRVVIIGGGTVGTNAAQVALGLGAEVTLFDVNLARLRRLAELLAGRVSLVSAELGALEEAVAAADLVVGAVLVPGAKAPKVVTTEMIRQMRPGSVIVDVAIDQGGCVEGAVPTTHDAPVVRVEQVILYSVANLPASTARTSTLALVNATFPYVSRLANLGYREALRTDHVLLKGLNTIEGRLVCAPVAESLGLEYCPYSAD
ncbi:MAG: alanine dehydrogenase [Thermoleophilia bacterium]|nr:alanine dehydrogenase [Thermoleophilia bacterium]